MLSSPMRKLRRAEFAFLVSLLCLMVPPCIPCPAQQQNAAGIETLQAAPKLPKNMKELIALAAKANDLGVEDIQPWHLKAAFTTLNDQGKPEDIGGLEEFWVNPHLYKVVYFRGSASQTVYMTSGGLTRSGSQEISSELYSIAAQEFTVPFKLFEGFLQTFTFFQDPGEYEGIKLSCIAGIGPAPTIRSAKIQTPTLCLDKEQLTLRVSRRYTKSENKIEVAHRNVASFQGRYVPTDLVVTSGKRKVFLAHLRVVELLQPTVKADFVPPPDASPIQIPLPFK